MSLENTPSQILSEYVIRILNNLENLSSNSNLAEIVSLLPYSPINHYLKIFEDCLDFYSRNNRYPDKNYILSMHSQTFLFNLDDKPFSQDIYLKFLQILQDYKKIDGIDTALKTNDIAKIRELVNTDVRVDEKPLLSEDNIFDEYTELETRPKGLMTGIPDLDYWLKGLDYGSLNVIGAKVGCFKTTTACSLAYNAIFDGKNVVIVTLEVTPFKIWANLYSRHSLELYKSKTIPKAIPAVEIKKATLDSNDKQILKEVQDNWIANEDRGTLKVVGIENLMEYSLEYFEAYFQKLSQEMGGIDMIFIDYLGLLKNRIPSKLKLDQYQALNYYVDSFQVLAVKYNWIVVLLAQITREATIKMDTELEKADKKSTDTREVTLATTACFAEANSLERSAMTAMVLHATVGMKNQGVMNIHLIKNRDYGLPDKPLQTKVDPVFFSVGLKDSLSNMNVISSSFNSQAQTLLNRNNTPEVIVSEGADYGSSMSDDALNGLMSMEDKDV